MEKYIYIGAAGVVVLYILYKLITSRRNRRIRLLARVKAAFGAVPDREYTEEELKKIRIYSDTIRSEDDFYIDDITWNDLDMDAIFAAMNQTFSSSGEEVLYDILRRPVFSSAELEERDRVIRFFQTHDKEREEIAMDYASIGRTKKYSLIEFLSMFRTLQLAPDIKYILHMLLIPASIVMAVIQPLTGIVVLIGMTIVNLIMYYRYKGGIEPYYVSLQAMAYLVDAASRIMEHEEPEIRAYTERLKKETAPVRSISRNIKWLGNGSIGTSTDLIQVILDYFRMITHVDFLIFNRMVKRVVNNESHILNIFRTMGFLEAMLSMASYRACIPFYTTGVFSEEKDAALHISDGYHPLLREPVANSFTEKAPMLITGSNASGKSTFLRMTALCAVMAQTVCTVHAHAYEGSFYRIYSSMALRDDIQSSESYFIVEIRSMKRIMDASSQPGPRVLCFVDEVLRGTNTVERIAASSQILKELAHKKTMVFAATHDIELTELLKNEYANYHFTEEIEDGAITFSYKLKAGRATSRNAIRLLEMMGYDSSVVEKAQEEAEVFVNEGTWKLL